MGDVISFATRTPFAQPKRGKTKVDKYLEEYERTFDYKRYHDRTPLQQAVRTLACQIILPVSGLPENKVALGLLLQLYEKIGRDLQRFPSRYG